MTEITSMKIEYPDNGDTASGYLVRPEQGSGPGVILIQEWWGLNEHIKDVAKRFAREGYVALAPDLYQGEVTSEPDEARKLSMDLDRPHAMTVVAAAARFLKTLDEVAPKNVGVVGWCMGGAIAFGVSHSSDQFSAAVGFYGTPPSDDETARINCAVLGLFGEFDQGVPPDMAEKFRSALETHEKTHEIHVYPETPHAFFNDTRLHIYRPEAAQDAWQKTLDWFQTHLS